MPKLNAKTFGDVGNYVGKIVNVKTRQFMLDVWTELVNTTPVKTGKARYSWKISAGSPFTKEIPDGTYGYPPLPNLDRYIRNWTKWYIANTAPYILELDGGSSKQAPSGFIKLSIDKVIIRYA